MVIGIDRNIKQVLRVIPVKLLPPGLISPNMDQQKNKSTNLQMGESSAAFFDLGVYNVKKKPRSIQDYGFLMFYCFIRTDDSETVAGVSEDSCAGYLAPPAEGPLQFLNDCQDSGAVYSPHQRRPLPWRISRQPRGCWVAYPGTRTLFSQFYE